MGSSLVCPSSLHSTASLSPNQKYILHPKYISNPSAQPNYQWCVLELYALRCLLCLLLIVIPSYCHIATTAVFEKPRTTPFSLRKKAFLCLLIVIKIKVQICREAIKCPLGPAWSCSGLHLNFFSTYLTPPYWIFFQLFSILALSFSGCFHGLFPPSGTHLRYSSRVSSLPICHFSLNASSTKCSPWLPGAVLLFSVTISFISFTVLIPVRYYKCVCALACLTSNSSTGGSPIRIGCYLSFIHQAQWCVALCLTMKGTQ